jgi:hypothetical protein
MNGGAIVCRYVFSTEEFKRGLRLFRRTTFSRRDWYPTILVLIVCAIVMVISNFIGSPHDTKPAAGPAPTNFWWALVINFLPVVLFVLLLIFLFGRQRKNSFQHSTLYNRDLTYRIAPGEVVFVSPEIESKLQWSSYEAAGENEFGFVLVPTGKRAFSWLPKDGFESNDDVERCRELLREHVADTTKLFARETT